MKSKLILLLIFGSLNILGQDRVDEIVDTLSRLDRVHTEGMAYVNHNRMWELYQELDSIVSEDKLEELAFQHNSPVINIYACYSLVKKNYAHLDSLLIYYFNNNKMSHKHSGSVVLGTTVADEIYIYSMYSNNSEKLNKVALSCKEITDFCSFLIFEYGEISEELMPLIEKQAFDWDNYDATEYLLEWHKERYRVRFVEEFKTRINGIEYDNEIAIEALEYYFDWLKDLDRDSNSNESEVYKFILNYLKTNSGWRKYEDKIIENLPYYISKYDIGLD